MFQIRTAVVCLFLLSGTLFAQGTNWDLWLKNEGYYLLSPEQKSEFRKLPEAEKGLYLQNLWATLDPDPITPENEFQIEYQKRYEVAKKRYGIPSDRAKIYLLLGKPNAVESHDNSDKYYPLELWSYYSLGYRGLPPSLDLIFFKRWGTGDYRLYSPIFDGFKALTPSGMDPSTNPRIQQQLKALFDASIVDAAEGITMGAGANESEQIRMTLQDPGAMNKILVQKQRPSVETTVVYQGLDASVYTYSVPHENGIFRTSIAFAVSPKHLTFEKDNKLYRARIDMTGRITDEKGNEIIKISDSPALKLSDADFEKAKSYFFGYQFDAFLLPGKYNLNCLFRDYASNTAGKIEKSFEVKPLPEDLALLPLLLAFKTAPANSENVPFGYNWRQYCPKENGAFNNGQLMTVYTSLLNPKNVKLEGIWQLQLLLDKDGKNIMELKEDLPLSSNLDLARKVKLDSLVPGPYNITMKLSRGTTTISGQSFFRVVDDQEVLGRIRITAGPGAAAPENYHTNLALQYFYQNNLPEAAKHVRIALDFAPSSYAARSLSARIEKGKGNVDAAIASYEKLLQESPADIEGFFLVGKWYMEKQDWQKGSDMMKKAMAAGYLTTELLNELAKAEIHMGKTSEAVAYWEKSIALNSNQPEVQEALKTHKQ